MKYFSKSLPVIFLLFSFAFLSLGNPSHLWSFHLNKPIDSFKANKFGQVVVVSADKMYVIDSNSGKLEWSFNSHADIDFYNIQHKGAIILCTVDNIVYSLNNKNGNINWHSNINEDVNEIEIFNNIVYIKSKNSLNALNVDTGNSIWNCTNIGSPAFDVLAKKNMIIFKDTNNSISASRT